MNAPAAASKVEAGVKKALALLQPVSVVKAPKLSKTDWQKAKDMVEQDLIKTIFHREAPGKKTRMNGPAGDNKVAVQLTKKAIEKVC